MSGSNKSVQFCTIVGRCGMRLCSSEEKNREFTVDSLRELSMFGALSNEAVGYLLNNGQVYEMEVGDRLFSYGDRSDEFYIIISGEVVFYQRKDCGGHGVPVRKYLSGEQLGFVGMIGLHTRRGDGIMDQSGFVLKISSALFQGFCESFSEEFKVLMINVAREMSREISSLDQMYSDVVKK